MNNPTTQIKQMTKNLFKAKSGSSHVKTLHPKRDWLMGMGVAFCIVLGITVWNAYTYIANREGGSTDTEIEIPNPRYQAELIDQALGIFETRANDFNATAGRVVVLPVVEDEIDTIENAPTTTPETQSTVEENEVLSEENTVEPVLPEDQIESEEVAPEVTETPDQPDEEFQTPELNQ